MNSKILLFSLFVLSIVSFSCKKDEDSTPDLTTSSVVSTPETYDFQRNGASSVNYQGQTDRLNQLSEIKSYMSKANNGDIISEQYLLDMYENANGNANGQFTFSSTKQLKDKTFAPDVSDFTQLLTDCAVSSSLGSTASNGKAGLLTRSNGKSILVDSNGREFVQIFEKGMMGATFLNQIFNTYLTSDKTGDNIDNTSIEEGKNYTTLEHHFDEAFGYFGAPTDFKSNYTGSGDPKFWASYSEEMDAVLGCNDIIMNAFKKGRAAIVANNSTVKNEQIVIIYNELERLAAAVAIHYVNETLEKTNDGDRLHTLSECYAFVLALRYQNLQYRKLTQDEVNQLLTDEIGSNFWETTEGGLNNIKNKLSIVYGLEAEKDLL